MLGCWLVVYTGCGSILLLLGLLGLWRSARLALVGVRVAGTVLGYEPADEGDGFARVEFTDLNGVVHRATLGQSGGPKEGQPIDLVYDPADPQEVSRASPVGLWFGPCLLCVLGLTFVGAGIGTLFGVL